MNIRVLFLAAAICLAPTARAENWIDAMAAARAKVKTARAAELESIKAIGLDSLTPDSWFRSDSWAPRNSDGSHNIGRIFETDLGGFEAEFKASGGKLDMTKKRRRGV
ncbi:MAG: hypothetical protein QGG25_02370, partial [Phycisphaerae bacterium]|nr:hypothetical protein [Phycisphaerae bacterium]